MTGISSYKRAFAIVLASLLLPEGAVAKQQTAPPGSPPPLSDAERAAAIPGVQFSDVIEAKGDPKAAQGPVRQGELLLSIPYAYRYTAVIAEDVKGFSFTVSGVQAPAGSPGYYAGSFTSSNYMRGEHTAPMDLWCFLPRVAGGKRENICLLRNNPARAAIAPTGMNPYLWDHFSAATGTFDYVNTPIFKRQAVELPIKPVLEYRFLSWKNNTAVLRVDTMGSSVSQISVPKSASGEYRLRTVGGDFLLSKNGGDASAAQIIAVASKPPIASRFVRVKLTIDANSRVLNCEVVESDAPEQLQQKTCEILRQTAKFTVSATTIEQTIRFQLPAD